MNLGLVNEVTKSQLKTDIPAFRSGSTVRVHVKIKEGDKSRIQVFEGVVIERAGGGISEITIGEGLSGAGTASSPLNLNIANYTSQSTISLSSTEGSVNLVGYNSVNLQETFGNKLTLAERGIVITTASGADVLLNEHASNSPSGFSPNSCS